ncbi:MAG: DUF4276 family protein [Myxococcota bacterium]
MRLIVVVEGQTEEAFVHDVLTPHLADHAVFASATIVGKVVAQRRGHRRRGGGHFRNWEADLRRLLASDRTADLRVTSLFDLYGLPNDFPGLSEHGAEPDTTRRCERLEATLARRVGDDRFIPYLQRHEFEALVLAALPTLRDLLDAADDQAGADQLAREIAGLAPEDVNDGEDTAPSKRLERFVPGYRKVLHGPLATHGAGLAALRSACPRFDGWVSRLETLG